MSNYSSREVLRTELARLYEAAGKPSVQAISTEANSLLPDGIRHIGRQRIHEWIVIGKTVPKSSEQLVAVVHALARRANRRRREQGGARVEPLPDSRLKELHRQAFEKTSIAQQLASAIPATDAAEERNGAEPENSHHPFSSTTDAENSHHPSSLPVPLFADESSPGGAASTAPSHDPPQQSSHRITFKRRHVFLVAGASVIATATLLGATIIPLTGRETRQSAGAPADTSTHSQSLPTTTSTSTTATQADVLAITSPSAGARVPRNVAIVGKTSLREPNALWMILRRVGGDEFHVTTLKPVSIDADGGFKSWAGIGRGSCDIGKEYELFAIGSPADSAISRRLRDLPGKYIHMHHLPNDSRRIGPSVTVTLASHSGARDTCPPREPSTQNTDPPRDRTRSSNGGSTPTETPEPDPTTLTEPPPRDPNPSPRRPSTPTDPEPEQTTSIGPQPPEPDETTSIGHPPEPDETTLIGPQPPTGSGGTETIGH